MAKITRAVLAAALLALCMAMFAAVAPVGLGGIDAAHAQSSVRPPSNATTSEVPGSQQGGAPPAARQGLPGRPAIQAPQLKDGAVPGGSLGTRSSSDIWRKLREGAPGTVSIPDKRAGELIRGTGQRLRSKDDILAAVQEGGSDVSRNNMGINSWVAFRSGPLATYGLYAMGGMLVLLALFFLVRGRIKIEHRPGRHHDPAL